ncbi:MAG: DNA cytosine methyltransferase [Spirulinaceae cyanobacterium]
MSFNLPSIQPPEVHCRPVAVDLFAGAGGFSLGIEQAGFDVAIAVEKDPVHGAVHQFNFPDSKVLWADIATLSGQEIEKSLNQEIGLLIGGPPCQGFSVMGKRNLKDERNNLIFHFCRLVKELQPRYFIMENVPGLTQKKYAAILTGLKEEFKAAGYQLAEPIQILNASAYGVPQERQRLFLLGTRRGETALTYPTGELTPQPTTVKEAIADLPNLDDFLELRTSDEVDLEPEQVEIWEAGASNYVKILRGIIDDPHNFAYKRIWNRTKLTSSCQTQHTTNSLNRFCQTLPGKRERISHLQRLVWDKPCHTLRAGTGAERGSYTSPRPLHPQYHRVISVREAARLHSFPDWFRLHGTKWHGFRQVGNAVPPLLARVLGHQVLEALGVKQEVPQRVLELGDVRLLNLTNSQAINLLHK